MVRVAGMKDTGWDSYTESIALLRHFTQLMNLELPADRFSHPRNTQVRLALIAYSHMIEMSVPYDLLANLLRLRLGMKYADRTSGTSEQSQGCEDKMGLRRRN